MAHPTTSRGEPSERRSDLDALRGFAMLLGIALHAAMSFFGGVWPVHDERQSRLLPMLFAAIHGFRMPLFFLLSGFFTMLVFRRRGLGPLLRQRGARIFLPLVISIITLVPLCHVLEERGVTTATREPLVEAIVAGNVAGAQEQLAAGATPDDRDRTFHRPLLVWAAMAGQPAVAAALCDAGADVNITDAAGMTPLHMAAFCGRADMARLLLARGANPRAESVGGTIPLESTNRSPTLAAAYLRLFGLPGVEAATIAAGRDGVRSLLQPVSGEPDGRSPTAARLQAVADRYWAWLASDRFLIDLGPAGRLHLVDTNVLEHLWFLWYLCWLVALFGGLAAIGLLPTGRQRWSLVVLSCLCQVLMEPPHSQLFGPDIAFGILPPPHLLTFYGSFYFFGVATFAREGTGTRLGAWWPLLVPLAIFVLFPASLATLANRPTAAIVQPAYAWTMSLGLIGLFHRFCSRPSPVVSWLSDASYWMYLAHLPLVMGGQLIIRDWPLPAVTKFLLLMAAVTAILLASYQWCVRYTLIGTGLNGPRRRREA